MEEGPLDLRGQLVANALTPVLADPSGRRARILGVASTALVALLLAWLLGLVVAGRGILPLAGLPLQRLLGGDPAARAQVPISPTARGTGTRHGIRVKRAKSAPSQPVKVGSRATGRGVRAEAGVGRPRLSRRSMRALTPPARKLVHRSSRHRHVVVRHPAACRCTTASRSGTAAVAPPASMGATGGEPTGAGSAPPRDVSGKAQSAPGRSRIPANPGAGRGHAGSEKSHGKGR
jgi:hypothetical protein